MVAAALSGQTCVVLEQIELSQAFGLRWLGRVARCLATFQIGEAFCRYAPNSPAPAFCRPMLRAIAAGGPVALAGGLGGHRSGFDGRVTVPALWDKVPAPRAVVGVICVRVSRGLCIQLAFTERIAGTKVERPEVS